MSTEGGESMDVKTEQEMNPEQHRHERSRLPSDLSKPTDGPAAAADAPKKEKNSNDTLKPEAVASSSTAAPNDESSETAASSKDDDRAWDTTDRKVVIHNVLKFNRPKEVQTMIDEWLEGTEFRVVKHKKPPKGNWVQLTLENVDMVEPFMEHMQQKRFTNRRGKPLFVKRVDPKVEGENGQKKRGRVEEEEDGASSSKRRKRALLPKTDDEVRDAITPLWRLGYEEQLKTKMRDMINNCAVKIVKELKGKFRTLARESKRNDNRKEIPVYDWINQQRAVDVRDILPSPKQTEYRNKCEFNFGYRHELLSAKDAEQAGDDKSMEEDEEIQIKQTPAVGFMASGWSGGVSSPHCCQNVPPEACAVADIVNEFLATSSIPPYDAKQHRGVWRTLTIRTSHRTKECMLVIIHAPASGGAGAKDESDDYTAIFEAEMQRLVSMLTERDLPSVQRRYPVANGSDNEKIKSEVVTQTCAMRVTSIFLQEFDGLSHPGPEHPVQHVYGKETFREELGKCTFQISPGAFFQVNTEGAEVLYAEAVKRVKEVATNPEDTLLFDVCCGTGTIGLTCMKEKAVGRIVGVDISEPAIDDAKINASLNGFGESADSSAGQLTHFVASRAESVLYEEIAKVRDAVPSIVAVVDPAREGLHPDVVRALRLNRSIRRIVYVSCNPTGSLVRDAGLLCGPPTKKYTGAPFRPTSAQPVDMFPLTPHCELVITFDRTEST